VCRFLFPFSLLSVYFHFVLKKFSCIDALRSRNERPACRFRRISRNEEAFSTHCITAVQLCDNKQLRYMLAICSVIVQHHILPLSLQ
jgi:hypothetical protein